MSQFKDVLVAMWLDQREMSLEDIKNLTNLTKNQVSYALRGIRRMDFLTVRKLEHAGMGRKWLYRITDTPNRRKVIAKIVARYEKENPQIQKNKEEINYEN